MVVMSVRVPTVYYEYEYEYEYEYKYSYDRRIHVTYAIK